MRLLLLSRCSETKFASSSDQINNYKQIIRLVRLIIISDDFHQFAATHGVDIIAVKIQAFRSLSKTGWLIHIILYSLVLSSLCMSTSTRHVVIPGRTCVSHPLYVLLLVSENSSMSKTEVKPSWVIDRGCTLFYSQVYLIFSPLAPRICSYNIWSGLPVFDCIS